LQNLVDSKKNEPRVESRNWTAAPHYAWVSVALSNLAVQTQFHRDLTPSRNGVFFCLRETPAHEVRRRGWGLGQMNESLEPVETAAEPCPTGLRQRQEHCNVGYISQLVTRFTSGRYVYG
jgi:hypothetical protein